MSRIGKLPVAVPKGVTVSFNDGVVTVKGPKGELSQAINPKVNVAIEGDEVILTRTDDEKQSRAYHGLYRQLVNNMVKGVSEGYKKTLVINGVGYKADLGKGFVTLSLGYSTQIDYMIPEGIAITQDGPGKLVVEGIDKAKVGQTAAEIRSLRKPEPYKGKGIKYETENIRRKVGKSGGKK